MAKGERKDGECARADRMDECSMSKTDGVNLQGFF